MTGTPNMRALGRRFGKNFNSVASALRALTHKQLIDLTIKGKIEVEISSELSSVELSSKKIIVVRSYSGTQQGFIGTSDSEVLVCIDITIDNEILVAKMTREIISRVQRLRKKAGVVPTDQVEVFYDTYDSETLKNIFNNNIILEKCQIILLPILFAPDYRLPLAVDNNCIDEHKLSLQLFQQDFAIHGDALAAMGVPPSIIRATELFIGSRISANLEKELIKDHLIVNICNRDIKLELGKTIFKSVHEAVAAGLTYNYRK